MNLIYKLDYQFILYMGKQNEKEGTFKDVDAMVFDLQDVVLGLRI